MEPTPEHKTSAEYRAVCRARFMEATRPNHRAGMLEIDRCLDDWLTWFAVYGE